MTKTRTATARLTDVADSRAKQSFARFTAETNPDVAEKMANAIVKDTSLLSGLAPMVTLICKHAKPRAILSRLFAEQPEISSRFPHAYQAFATAQLFG